MNMRVSIKPVFVLLLALLVLAACGVPAEAPPIVVPADTAVLIPLTAISTDTAVPIPPTKTPEPAPAVIPATQDPIQVGAFEFRVLQTAFDDGIGGMVPHGMGNDRILFIEFEMISGDNADFAALKPVVVLESGELREPVAIISANTISTLADMTYTGVSGSYAPSEGAVVLAYVVPADPGNVLLEFPAGEIIDMTPLMR
ncbi:MAG: hypothetical protein JXA97_12110 [Anaerolineales bacterium]|nr:hypothetical protein [Anaerolineales bacterium]